MAMHPMSNRAPVYVCPCQYSTEFSQTSLGKNSLMELPPCKCGGRYSVL